MMSHVERAATHRGKGGATVHRRLVGTLAAVVVAAAAVVAAGEAAWATEVKAAGQPPQSVQQGVTVNIQPRVGIIVTENSLTIDPSAQPTDGPKYPWPENETQAFYGAVDGSNNRKTFQLKVFSNKANGFTVGVSISGMPTWLPNTDWYIAVVPADTSLPGRPTYSDPSGGWVAIGTGKTIISGSSPTGWKTYNADVVAKFTGDEPDGTLTGVQLVYTITAAGSGGGS